MIKLYAVIVKRKLEKNNENEKSPLMGSTILSNKANIIIEEKDMGIPSSKYCMLFSPEVGNF